jgi:glycerol-3-phosphate dehydrogenase
MREACPALNLRREDVSLVNCGLVPFGNGPSTTRDLSFGKESRFIDHRAVHGVRNLVTVIGIRYTTARADAATALDMLLQQLPGGAPERAPTAHQPVAGGHIDDFERFFAEAQHHRPPYVSSATLAALLRNHGCNYGKVLNYARADISDARLIPGSEALMAEVTRAVNDEMAVHLDDVVLRRTDIGAGRHPGNAALEAVAARMQQLLGWSDARRREEAAATRATLARHWAHGMEVAAAAA